MLDYRKIVLLLFLIKNISDFVTECGFCKKDNNGLCLEFKKLILEEDEYYLD